MVKCGCMDKLGCIAILKQLTTKLRKLLIMVKYATNQKQLIDLVKHEIEVDTNYMVSKCLGIPESTINRAYRNDNFLKDYYIYFLCDVAKLDASKTLAYIREEEAKTKGKEKEQEFWHKVAAA